MKATFVDLRKKSAQILRALERNESVTIFYRGRPRAVMQPLAEGELGACGNAADHPAFGLWKDRDDLADVLARVRRMRQVRFE